MAKAQTCPKCNAWLLKDGSCLDCTNSTFQEPNDDAIDATREQLEKIKQLPVFTVSSPRVLGEFLEVGLVFGNSSRQAFIGLTSQANRLSRAYDAALLNLKYDAANLGADAVVGITFALNNSTGSNINLIGGSSEAVMLLGTAVRKL